MSKRKKLKAPKRPNYAPETVMKRRWTRQEAKDEEARFVAKLATDKCTLVRALITCKTNAHRPEIVRDVAYAALATVGARHEA